MPPLQQNPCRQSLAAHARPKNNTSARPHNHLKNNGIKRLIRITYIFIIKCSICIGSYNIRYRKVSLVLLCVLPLIFAGAFFPLPPITQAPIILESNVEISLCPASSVNAIRTPMIKIVSSIMQEGGMSEHAALLHEAPFCPAGARLYLAQSGLLRI